MGQINNGFIFLLFRCDPAEHLKESTLDDWGSCWGCLGDKGSQGSHIAELIDLSMLNTNLYVILVCSLNFFTFGH